MLEKTLRSESHMNPPQVSGASWKVLGQIQKDQESLKGDTEEGFERHTSVGSFGQECRSL